MRTIIYNGKLILKDTITEQGHVEITDGVITNVSQHNPNHDLLSHADNIIDAKGMHISRDLSTYTPMAGEVMISE